MYTATAADMQRTEPPRLISRTYCGSSITKPHDWSRRVIQIDCFPS